MPTWTVSQLQRNKEIPKLKDVMITFLTARLKTILKVGFEAGADDYTTKP